MSLSSNISSLVTRIATQFNTVSTAITNKVGADGSVTTHSDVTSAGSGSIITAAERVALNNALQPIPVQPVTGTSHTTDDSHYLILSSATPCTLNLQEFGAESSVLYIHQEAATSPVLGTLPTGMTISAIHQTRFQALTEGETGAFICVDPTPGSQVLHFI